MIDGGGGHGEWTDEVLKRWPAAHVYLFEPHPISRVICQKKFERAENVFVIPNALYRSVGRVPFYIDTGVEGFGSSVHCQSHHHHQIVMEAKTYTLSEFASGSHVNVLKLDLEGAEIDALMGMGEFRPDYIQFEFGEPWKAANYTITEAWTLLDKMGYKFDREMPTDWTFQNIVAIRK